jgi:UPF0755 protein
MPKELRLYASATGYILKIPKMNTDAHSSQKSKLSMKKLIFFIPLILGIIAAVLIPMWWTQAVQAPSEVSEEVRFVIPKGASAEKIGNDLEKEGLIKSALAFKINTQLNDETRKIPPGEFNVPKNLTLDELVAHLLKGPQEYWVTIPEGLRREEVVERFIEGLGLEGDKAQIFRSQFLAETRTSEGYLFPDSYLFPPDVTASAVIKRLRDTFDTKTAEFDVSQEDVILASIIERETRTDEERPVVAGIYMNRLKLGMPLQADATAQYAVANKRCSTKTDCDWWVTPLRSDLEISSPYNTYQIEGLPIGPIANPGITSLSAAVNPTNSDYIYYIHDEDGQIYYATTLDEHNSNVQKYLR